MTLTWNLDLATDNIRAFDRRHVQGACATSSGYPNDAYPFDDEGPVRHSFIDTDQGRALRLSMPSSGGSTSRYQFALGPGGGSDPSISLGSSTLIDRWAAFRCRLSGVSWPTTTDGGLAFFGVGFTSRFTNTTDNGPYGDLDTKGVGPVTNRYWGSAVNSTGNVEPPPSPSVGTLNAGPIVQGPWVTFVVHTGWSRTSSGFREIWRDGVRMGRYDGFTSWSMPGASTMSIEFRWGCYWGGGFTSPYTFDVSWLKLGTTLADVDPGGTPPPPANTDIADLDEPFTAGYGAFVTRTGLVSYP